MENIFVTWKNYNSKTIFFNWEIIIIDEGSKDNIIIIDIPGTIGGGIIMNASSRGKGLFILFFSIKSVQKIEKGVNDYNRVQVQDIHASQYIFLAQNVFFV